jgi:diguanylate cyclase (GGDEF)-like protein
LNQSELPQPQSKNMVMATGGSSWSVGQQLYRQCTILTLYVLLAFITIVVFETINVWPSAGVAVAGFLLYGRQIWPAVFVASLLVVFGFFQHVEVASSSAQVALICLLTAIGNTLSGYFALLCCGQIHHLFDSFADQRWVIRRFIPATVLSALVSAGCGVGVYWLSALPWSPSYLGGFLHWSVSNTVGALIMAPLLLGCALEANWRRLLIKLRLKLFAVSSLLLLGLFLFGPGQQWLPVVYLQPALLLVPLLFVALSSTATFVFIFHAFTFLLIWAGTNAGYGPFITSHQQDTDMSMLLFCGMQAVVVLIVQALQSEQRKMRKFWTAELLSSHRQLEQRVQQRTRELELANQQLELLSVTDPLTQLANRRRFDSYLSAEWQRACRLQQPLGLMMIDVDWFKNYNDRYGHLQGDACLKQIAQLMRLGARRSTDLAARFGGEEFALVVPQADSHYLQQQAELMRMAFASLNIPHQSSPLGRVTVSIGIAVLQPDINQQPQLLVELADQALYQAKALGRNQVAVAERLAAAPIVEVMG